MSAVDATWLRMDRPDNLMVIESVVWFDTPMDWDRLAGVVRRRMVARYPVFRERPVYSRSPLIAPHWEDDPGFRLERHIVRARLAEPGDEAALERYVEAQMHRPFRRNHPLWEMHFVDGFGSGSALVVRLHHALADGIALSQVLLSLTDASRTGDLRDREPTDETLAAGPNVLADSVGGLAGTVGGLASTVGGLAGGGRRMLSTAGGLATPGGARNALATADGTVRASGKILLHRNPPSPLRGTPGRRKLAAWSAPHRLADVSRIARLADATVNDVMVAAVSGALHAYLLDRGAPPVDLATMVPVNLRPAGEELPQELGNRFALVLLPLPTGVHSPLLRLEQTKQRMDSIKHSPEAALTFGLLAAIGRTHPEVERRLIDFFTSKAIGVTTNVVGPRRRRYLAGSPIAGVLSWVPGSGSQTLNVAIFSDDRSVRVGFKADARVVPDVAKIVHAFDAEMDQLTRIARAA
jgi:WS/DGAT/MGAT family acyltransferase